MCEVGGGGEGGVCEVGGGRGGWCVRWGGWYVCEVGEGGEGGVCVRWGEEGRVKLTGRGHRAHADQSAGESLQPASLSQDAFVVPATPRGQTRSKVITDHFSNLQSRPAVAWPSHVPAVTVARPSPPGVQGNERTRERGGGHGQGQGQAAEDTAAWGYVVRQHSAA